MLLWDRGGGVGVKEILINESIVLRAPGCGVSDGKGLLAEEWEKGKNYEKRKNERQGMQLVTLRWGKAINENAAVWDWTGTAHCCRFLCC